MVVLGLTLHYPGSIAAGWEQTSGSVASAVGKQTGGRTLYYATVQYTALGYSYEVQAKHGSTQYPAPGTPVAVAFDPGRPQHARLLSEAPPNYFQAVFPALGVLSIATGAILLVRGYFQRRSQARLLTGPEAAETAALPTDEETAQPAPEAPVETAEPETMSAEEPVAIDESAAAEPLPQPGEVIQPKPPATKAKSKKKPTAASPRKKPVRKAAAKKPTKKQTAKKPTKKPKTK